jgi:hypothetical protein
MFTIEFTLKGNPIALSVQRKDQTSADALYAEVVSAMTAQPPRILEMTCDKQEGKKLAILSADISAVQISEKSGAVANTGAGFVRS